MDIADLSALLGEDVGAATTADVWVVVPAANGQLGEGELALVGEARRLADGLGCYVHVVVGAESVAQTVIAGGADRVHVTADAAGYISGQQPEFVLLPSTQNVLAARLAQHFHAGLITDVRGAINIDPDTRALVAPHPVYDGQYYLDLAVTSTVKLATIDTGGLAAPAADPSRAGEIAVSELPSTEERWRDLGPTDYLGPAWRPLSKARAILAVGRGLHYAEGLALATRLARMLGAELAGDRSARDSEWVDEAHEVGVTGQEVAPELYVALGIRGDTIHNAAITGARQVIAVHADPNAPIFKVADVGLVAEPKAVLSELIALLQ